jgi:DNA-binding PadR family transcriptional regulator
MPKAPYLGEFEQQLLLVILRLGADAFGPDIARELETRARRRVSRGALYTTLDRLADKGLVRWKTVPGTEARDGLPRRLYSVPAAGIAAVKAAREVARRLWDGLDARLEPRKPRSTP